jgi:hypothetical protein
MQAKMAKLQPELTKLKRSMRTTGETPYRNDATLSRTWGQLFAMLAVADVDPADARIHGALLRLQESVFGWPAVSKVSMVSPGCARTCLRWGESLPHQRAGDIGGMIYLGPFFNILPILAALMLIQQKKMMPASDDPGRFRPSSG